jgi:hypothetical protein
MVGFSFGIGRTFCAKKGLAKGLNATKWEKPYYYNFSTCGPSSSLSHTSSVAANGPTPYAIWYAVIDDLPVIDLYLFGCGLVVNSVPTRQPGLGPHTQNTKADHDMRLPVNRLFGILLDGDIKRMCL